MKHLTQSSLAAFAVLTTLMSAQSVDAGEDSIQYEVRFDAIWSSSSHPTAFPSNAHFSPLVGGIHHSGVSFWEPRGIASAGIERMAESGGTSLLLQEVQAAITDGTAESIAIGQGTDSPGSVTTTITVSSSHPLVTLVTMIAPSPDWFVGVHGQSLQTQDGLWIPELIVELDAYDAGTDSGANYTSSNSNTNPQDPITNVAAAHPFNNNGSIGTLTFTRITEAPCSIADFSEPFHTLDVFDAVGFIEAFNTENPQSDFAEPAGVFDVFDVLGFIQAFNDGCAI